MLRTLLLLAAAVGAAAAAEPNGQDPDASLRRLAEGNRHYVHSTLAHPHQTVQRRAEIAKAQHPFATILSCSDSRVPPEILFDQGLGDLFVVRVAGNVAEDATAGSIEYAAEHLHTPVVVVLGHERCGAVQAAVQGGHVSGSLAKILDEIHPAVVEAGKQQGDTVENAVTDNVRLVVGRLQRDPVLSELIASGKLRVVGAKYSLDTGEVVFLK